MGEGLRLGDAGVQQVFGEEDGGDAGLRGLPAGRARCRRRAGVRRHPARGRARARRGGPEGQLERRLDEAGYRLPVVHGIVPGYTGHVPNAIDKHGTTYFGAITQEGQKRAFSRTRSTSTRRISSTRPTRAPTGARSAGTRTRCSTSAMMWGCTRRADTAGTCRRRATRSARPCTTRTERGEI